MNKSLLGWCRDQKRRKLEGGLSLEQIEKLDAVNFNWVIQKSDWHKWYAQLKEFFEQNGHCRIVGNGRSLRGWCVRTRALYHQNKLSQEQIRLMEQLNFSWDVWGDAWQTNIQKLRAFKEQYGNCLVPPSVDIVLARWVFGLRNDRKRGCLSEEQIQQLDEVGFVWYPEQYLWLETYQAMKWHLKVTKRNKPLTKETRLFGWYKNQKQLIRANRMPADRIKLLMDIGLDVFDK